MESYKIKNEKLIKMTKKNIFSLTMFWYVPTVNISLQIYKRKGKKETEIEIESHLIEKRTNYQTQYQRNGEKEK